MKYLSKKILFVLLLFTKALDAQTPVTNYNGNWTSDSTTVTVRKKTGFLKYEFKKEKVKVNITISPIMLASGNIGLAQFKNAEVVKSKGSSVVYKIRCGTMNKLFNADDTGEKEIELWILPQKNTDQLNAEIRLKSSSDLYPMGEIIFKRK